MFGVELFSSPGKKTGIRVAWMRSSRASFLRRYGCAVAGIGLATGLRLLLDPVLQDRFPFATVLFAVMVAAWHGGFGPAVTATLLGALASDHFLLSPRNSFAVEGFENQAGMVLYLGIGLGIAVLGGVMRAAQERSGRSRPNSRSGNSCSSPWSRSATA